jgi:hypothetical protein
VDEDRWHAPVRQARALRRRRRDLRADRHRRAGAAVRDPAGAARAAGDGRADGFGQRRREHPGDARDRARDGDGRAGRGERIVERRARCIEILQKASLEKITPTETDFFKRECK